MEIGINIKAALVKKRTGVEEYVYNLIKSIIALNPKDEIFLFGDRPLTSYEIEEFLGLNLPANIHYCFLKSKYLWTQGRLALELLKKPLDVFFNPVHVLPRFSPRRSTVTIHDLAFEIFPETYNPLHLRYLRHVTSRSVESARHIIAVSHNTKEDIMRFFDVPAEKIQVIYHGFSSSKRPEDPKQMDFVIQGEEFLRGSPYLLFLGRLELKKNLIRSLNAFFKLKEEKGIPHKFVLAGEKGFGWKRINKVLDRSPYRKDVIMPGHLSGEQKERLLRGASILVMLSLYEGFGLPVLEAQGRGVPVIASNCSALPEVAGKGALLVNPFDENEIKSGIWKIIRSQEIAEYYIRKGYENIKRFNWGKTAQKTLELIKK